MDVRLTQFFKEALIRASQVIYLFSADARSYQLNLHLLFHVHMPRFTRVSLSQSNPPLSVPRASVNSLYSIFYLNLVLFSCCTEETIATLLLKMKSTFGGWFFPLHKCVNVTLLYQKSPLSVNPVFQQGIKFLPLPLKTTCCCSKKSVSFTEVWCFFF